MKMYSPEPLNGHEICPFLFFRYAPEKNIGGLFKDNLPPNYFEEECTFVDDTRLADAIVLPNNFRATDDSVHAYIARYVEEGERLGKPVILFSLGDFTDHLVFDERVVVFVSSLYKKPARLNQVIVPALTGDIAPQGITIRNKIARPVVSFCGQAGYKTALQWVKYFLKNLYFNSLSLMDPSSQAHKLGVYWRRAVLRACRGTTLVETNFIIRHSFSGALRTIELSPAQARKEFIESIIESDFVLAPKGDGNYSNRFLEALAAGRIPVVVDTDIVLPLEEVIDYSKIMVRIPMNRVARTPEYIREWYDALTREEWAIRQHLARETFEGYLRQDSFWRYYFTNRLGETL